MEAEMKKKKGKNKDKPPKIKLIPDYLKSLPFSDLIGTSCEDCARKEIHEGEDFICTALNRFYFQYRMTKCWCYCSNWNEILKMLDDVKGYLEMLITKSKNNTSAYIILKDVKREEEKAKKVAGRIESGELKRFYRSQVHRGHGGGGEKQKGNELFPESRMKDNRYIPPWGSEGGTRDGGLRFNPKPK
jgi:hypothetical protein